jgi:hypothetical protein
MDVWFKGTKDHKIFSFPLTTSCAITQESFHRVGPEKSLGGNASERVSAAPLRGKMAPLHVLNAERETLEQRKPSSPIPLVSGGA